MDKSKLSFSGIGKYLREISVVVIGVAITLSASDWITSRNEKRDVALYLNAIKLEMNTNIKILDKEAEYQENWENYGRYLASHDKKSLNPDSIRPGNTPGFGEIKTTIFQTSAFEMFKSSGAMRLMDDKELLQSIWNAYLGLESLRWGINQYYELKHEEIKKEIQLDLEEKPNPIPMYDFFAVYTNFGLVKGCKDTSNELKEIGKKLEKY